MKTLLETKTSSLMDLIGNGKSYKIPTFQRDYSWSESNWEDMWNDFISSEDSENPHYLGTIVLQNQSEDEYIIVDGQQRLTTLTIYAMSTIKLLNELVEENIDKDNNIKRIEEIKRTCIGKQSIATLYYQSKLKLNKNNDLFFQHNILLLKKPISISKLNDSEKLLWNCLNYFYEKIKEKFNKNGKAATNFLESIVLKKMIFIQITVDNELQAYTVFETLNARGVELTTTDLLKNYLFSITSNSSSESEISILEEKWNKLVHIVGFNEFPVFLRYYINSKKKLIRKDQLFKIIKTEVKNSKDVFNLIEELESKSYLYNAIKNPDDDYWNDFSNEKSLISRSLREMKLFGVTQPIPLLFSIYDNKRDLFSQLLKDLVSISFRYNIIAKKNPNELEVVYNTISTKLVENEISMNHEIYNLLRKIYINDEDFKFFFSTKEITTGGRSKKLVKYILTKIENQISNSDNDWNDANFTIEHILPENYDSNWDKQFNNNAHKFVYRLGNYTLLEFDLNKKSSNNTYEIKKKYYRKSRYIMTNNYCIKDEWNISAIDEYQKKLAKISAGIWKINFNN